MADQFNPPVRPPMPACGHVTAPTFDPEQPRTLRRFFQDLETLFERSGVKADHQKKEWVVRYLPIDVAELCKSLPEYYADNKSYDDFCQAIIVLYPGASNEQKYSIADVENLVVRCTKSAIANISELSASYREFFAMTSYLIDKLKLPDHYPDDPYTLEQVYNAAKFVLHGTLSSTSSSLQSANASSGGLVKTEEIAPILRYLVQAIAEQPSNHGYGGNGFAGPHYQPNVPPPPPPRFPNAPYPQQDARPMNNNNNFCYYFQPGNQAAQLFFVVAPKTPPTVTNFHLTTNECINQLERELFAFERNLSPHMSIQAPCREEHREVDSGNRSATKSRETRREHRVTSQTDGQGTKECRASLQATATAIETSTPVEGGQPDSMQCSPTMRPAPEQSESAAHSEHPFAKVCDTTYALPKACNFGAPPVKMKESDHDPAYCTQAPIHNPKVDEEIFVRSMKAPVISLLPKELLSIAPEVRAKYHKAVMPKRVPMMKTIAFTQFTEEFGEDCEDADDAKPFLSTVTCDGEALEPGGYVLPDPYEVYLCNIAPEDNPKSLVIAKESHALRSIVGLMANKEYVEGVMGLYGHCDC
ncbi:hypothetical protein BN946_scf184742.g2 [Trametes cinnabarina]|uniref:Uncharacterized protein n=1 Tax=Pycnoporus cinnabarinus TaxID=5643 RepID=A0A060SAU8_PYCCI|nr:hypothetical protein BN946_scf184742.g2 [Trametes cinnabarina]